jgi:hypothetical protein
MPLLGDAALAMWWDMAPAMRAEFQHWHTHEHFPERLSLPGFRRASRWQDAGGSAGFFVLYELASHEVLSSSAYLARLNAPTPWSTQLMPHHANMVRSQCRVLASEGCAIAAHALTVRLSPQPSAREALERHLRSLLAGLAVQPGFVGAHLLHTDTPPMAQTTEQAIRGHDQAADWICVVTGYDADELRALAQGQLSAAALISAGAQEGAIVGLYSLAASMHAAEL